MSKINTARVGARGRVRVKFLRAWGGNRAGDIVSPPAAARQMLLQTKDPLGKKVAEEVVEPATAETQQEDQTEARLAEVAPECSEAELVKKDSAKKAEKSKKKK